MRVPFALAAFLSLTCSVPAEADAPLCPAKISADGRFLLQGDGRPFFYLADTAWELFHRLDREEATRYLQDRASKGFTVIQAVALAELDGLTDPNPYGKLPLVDLDPARPAVVEGPENDYWDHVDFIVDKANDLGLVVGFLPTWGRYWRDRIDGKAPVFTPANAEVYGKWLGRRYGGKAVIWILGGDRPIENDGHRAVIEAMARGIRAGEPTRRLITFHPPGGTGSTQWFAKADWIDFQMRQNGHVPEYTGRYENTSADYRLEPAKPVIDGEPIYEDHPISFNAKKLGHSTAIDVRRPLYWDLFSGACGHTYGHHSVWQMWTRERRPINGPLMPWDQALEAPGAGQMIHGRRLIESRPILSRIPDDSLVVVDAVPTSVPGAGLYRFAATRDREGSYAMVYVPVGRRFEVKLDAIAGETVRAWWFDPRTGRAEKIGEFPSEGTRSFTSPTPGEPTDWVLVLDDAARGYPAPGTGSSR
ncbi:MAG: glycoside hydrolase family 140 protein [Isosphaeraceae bacterium]|nr:glycoside hydrolase family 140 protein [Isosphaeraceae bacterium]